MVFTTPWICSIVACCFLKPNWCSKITCTFFKCGYSLFSNRFSKNFELSGRRLIWRYEDASFEDILNLYMSTTSSRSIKLNRNPQVIQKRKKRKWKSLLTIKSVFKNFG